jgi:hypothetical protein
MSDERATYRFGPLERHGLLGPIRLGQALAVGVGAVAAVIALDTGGGPSGALIGILLLGVSIVLAAVPLGGRTAEQWLPVLAAHNVRMVSGRLKFRARFPTRGVRVSVSGARTRPASPIQLPAALRGIEIKEIDHRGRPVGLLTEQRGRLLTAVIACRVVAFALLDPEAQERKLARFGSVLAATASTPIRRLQWLERTAPARGDELARWLHEARDPGLPARGAPIIESYLELISASTRVTQEHEILLAVQIDSARVHGRRDSTPKEIAVEQAERVARMLAEAEIEVLGVLGPGQLARVLRTAFDPYVRTELSALEDQASGRAEGEPEQGYTALSAQAAAPLAAQERWDGYRCDGAHHATFWIGGWPRSDVSPMFMEAILGGSDVVRTVAVTFEPIAPDRSTREAEAAVTRDRADSELRRRFGQSETARQRLARDAAMRREAELAAGHGEVRVTGFVTVSGRDEDELSRACAEIRQRATRARLELHRMYGQQAEAFTFTLPLARGLR